jgi:hypothetical protein
MSGRTLVLVLAIVGCAPRGNAQDEMGRFSGLARVTCAAGGVGYAAALSEDMPGAGWENRWRVVLSVEVPAPCLKPLEIRGVWIREARELAREAASICPDCGFAAGVHDPEICGGPR